MILPGVDFRGFGYNVQERAHAVYDALARRYARLAQKAVKRGQPAVAARYVIKALEGGQGKRVAPTSRSFAGLIEPAVTAPRTHGDMVCESRLHEQARLASVFKLAIARGPAAVDLAIRLLADDGVKTREVATVLRSMPETPEQGSRPHNGLAARIAARDALAATPPSDPTPNRAAELLAAYNKAIGRAD